MAYFYKIRHKASGKVYVGCQYKQGANHHMFGKKHSEETKRKISKSRKTRNKLQST